MGMAGSVVEGHQRFHLRDRAEAEAVLGDLLDAEIGAQTGLEGAGIDLSVHRFRLNGVAGVAIQTQAPLALSLVGRRYFGCIAARQAVSLDGVARCERHNAVIIAPGRSHRLGWPAGAVLLGCVISPADMARYGGLASVASSQGFGADGIMVVNLAHGPFRLLDAAVQLLSGALNLDQHPVAVSAVESVADPGMPAVVPKHVKRAEDYLARHLADPLTVAELAMRVGVSVRSLHRGFLDFRGVTPARYLQNLRIEAAHRLMTSGDCMMGLRQVAAEVGFGSYAPFWRAYVRKYGCAPSLTRRGDDLPSAPMGLRSLDAR